MKKKFYLLLAVCLYGMVVCADPISKQQAQQIAAGWLKGTCAKMSRSKGATPKVVSTPEKMKTDRGSGGRLLRGSMRWYDRIPPN